MMDSLTETPRFVQIFGFFQIGFNIIRKTDFKKYISELYNADHKDFSEILDLRRQYSEANSNIGFYEAKLSDGKTIKIFSSDSGMKVI